MDRVLGKWPLNKRFWPLITGLKIYKPMVIVAHIWYIEMDAMKGIDRVLKSLMKYSSFFEVFKGLGFLPTIS